MANPFAIEFEEGFPVFNIPATATATVTEVGPGGVFPASLNPISCIRRNQNWGVQVTWSTSGSMGWFMGGEWVVQVYLEQMGTGEVSMLSGSPQKTPLVAADPYTYTVNLPFNPANSALDPLAPGAYKIAVTVTMQGPGGVPGPVAGTGEGPLLQFYDTPF